MILIISFNPLFCSGFITHSSYTMTRPAHLIIHRSCELHLALCYVAVAAALYGVGVIVGEGLSLLAGVESEDASCVLGCGLLSEAECLLVVGGGVFGSSHLYGVAPTVPPVGRIVGIPEGVGWR